MAIITIYVNADDERVIEFTDSTDKHFHVLARLGIIDNTDNGGWSYRTLRGVSLEPIDWKKWINGSFTSDEDLESVWDEARKIFFEDDESLEDAFATAVLRVRNRT